MTRTLTLLLSTLLIFSLSPSAFSETTSEATQKTVLVTGASSGIGKRIAMTLAEKGYYVYAGARKAEDIAALSALKNIEGIRLDVTVQSDIDQAVARIGADKRGLYGLVNNAGVFLFDPLIEVSEQDMNFIFDVNVMGPFRVSKAFAPLIIRNKGRITTIGSVAGITSGQLFGPYSMSKFAIEAYSEALAGELAKFEVAVSVIEPGNFQSKIMKNMKGRLQKLRSAKKDSLYTEEIERFAGFTATDRSHHADPAPVAEAVHHFLSSDEPYFRYLVTPNDAETRFTLRSALRKVLELNQYQEAALSVSQLTDILNELQVELATR